MHLQKGFFMIAATEKALNFTLNDQNGHPVSLKDFLGKWVILYFYPKDNTPGCTEEASDFSRLSPQIENGIVIGISPDSSESHRKFIDKHDLSLILLSDPDKQVMKQYRAWGLKKNYGKEYEGVIRSTFLIDPSGMIIRSWKNVRAKGHAEKVVAAFEKLRSS
jgi:thioredoxin-dependent peroxiredoxin